LNPIDCQLSLLNGFDCCILFSSKQPWKFYYKEMKNCCIELFVAFSSHEWFKHFWDILSIGSIFCVHVFGIENNLCSLNLCWCFTLYKFSVDRSVDCSCAKISSLFVSKFLNTHNMCRKFRFTNLNTLKIHKAILILVKHHEQPKITIHT
jgi:hypothetical protein